MILQKLKSVLENKTYKILRSLEMQKDDTIETKRPNLVLFNKKKMI